MCDDAGKNEDIAMLCLLQGTSSESITSTSCDVKHMAHAEKKQQSSGHKGANLPKLSRR